MFTILTFKHTIKVKKEQKMNLAHYPIASYLKGKSKWGLVLKNKMKT